MVVELLPVTKPMEIATSTKLETASPPRSTGIWDFIGMGAIVGLLGALYSQILPDLATEWWTQPEASYGLLIPPMALYIMYARRRTTFAYPARRDLRGLAVTCLGCLVLLSGELASEFYLARISIVFILAGLIWTFWGGPRLRTLAFPLVLLATMVPLPALVYNAMAAPLQLFASAIATDLAQIIGVSIYRDGNIIHLASTSLGVAEACSGLHSLSALVIGALLLGFLEGASVVGRVVLLLLSVPLAIGVNVLRVTGTAILADYKPEYAEGYYHSFSGWLVFVLGFGLLWILGKLVFRWTRTSRRTIA